MKKKLIILFIIILIIIFTFIGIKVLIKESDNNIYTITTDLKYLTMQNDGGSNTSVYYEFNPNKKSIKKLEDSYNASIQGGHYDYKGKEIYNKTINSSTTKELKDLLNDLISKEDINNPKNYEPYTIKYKGKKKSIYNKESIKLLEEKLEEIDNY
ncbi:MAG: hypothetical protein VZS44_05565 [Bacilli bacterium]|nr:hypothetical protein [Bacilli bacterium]